MTVWFTADTHFQHTRLLELADRPFTDIDEHDVAMIETWNATIGPNDTVFHLGDFALGPKVNHQGIFDQLNGNKHLIRGNHDGRVGKPYNVTTGWVWVKDIHYLRHEGARVFMSHYPHMSWPGSGFHAHGHTHGSVPRGNARIDVGWDVWSAPVSLEHLVELTQGEVQGGHH